MSDPIVPPQFNRRFALLGTAAVAGLAIIATAAAYLAVRARSADAAEASSASQSAATAPAGDKQTVQLSDSQLGSIKVAPVVDRDFPIRKEAVGSIDFDEDMNVQVFTPYQGKIIQTYADLGDLVKKDQILFTIDSPDLVQAESTLIAAAATYDQNNRALVRAQKLYDTQGTGGISELNLDAAVQAKLAAEGA